MYTVFYDLTQSKTGRLVISAANAVEVILNGNNEGLVNESGRVSWNFCAWIKWLIRSPIVFLYYFYIWLPLFFFTLALKYIMLVIRVSAKRSPRLNKLRIHILAFGDAALSLYRHMRSSSPADIIGWLLQTVFEVITTAITGTHGDIDRDNEYDDEFGELVFYKEFEDKNYLPPSYRRRMRKMMHYDIPTYPFVASVRLHSRGATPQRTRANTLHSEWSEAGSVTPGSFPPSPVSRANIIIRGFDRSDNTVFRARDKLRLEALASDSNEGIRRTASKLLLGGKYGTFDQHNSSQFVKLSYGFHCASRIAITGTGAQDAPRPPNMASTRASLSVRRNVYVYVEFFVRAIKNVSVQVDGVGASPVDAEESKGGVSVSSGSYAGQEAQGASFSVGLASADGNLDAEVGTYAKSVGFSSTGHLSVCSGPAEGDSSTFQLQSSVSSGDRVGMLLYLPCGTPNSGSPCAQRQRGLESCRQTSMRDVVSTPEVGEVVSQSSTHLTHDSETGSYWDTDLSEENSCCDEHGNRGPCGVDGQNVASICFNVNGCAIPLPMVARFDMSDILWGADEDVYPTLSLHADNFTVWAGFSVDDVKFRAREHICAPPGEVIYCLDGSVLIDANS